MVGWDSTPGGTARRADGSRYGYDLIEGDVNHGRHPYIEGAIEAAKNLKKKGEKS